MMDTMTLTKAGGALCGALLIYLLGVWFAETLYHSAGGHDAHGDGDHDKPYMIAVEEAGSAGEVEEGPDFATVFASADAGKGERAFSKCKACHKLEAVDGGTGPHLVGLVGREIAGVAGYSYSGALAEVGGTWTPEALNDWLENPKGFAPGTKMSLATKKIEDRANLIAYLQTIGG